MATALDTKLGPKIKALIDDKGKDAVFIKGGVGRFNASDSTVDEADIREWPRKVVLDSYKAHEVDGERVRFTDLKCFVAAHELAFTPDTDMAVKLVSEGEQFRVIATGRHYTGELIGLWELQLRR